MYCQRLVRVRGAAMPTEALDRPIYGKAAVSEVGEGPLSTEAPIYSKTTVGEATEDLLSTEGLDRHIYGQTAIAALSGDWSRRRQQLFPSMMQAGGRRPPTGPVLVR